MFVRLSGLLVALIAIPAAGAAEPGPKPTSHTLRMIEGWSVRIDDRLLNKPNEELGRTAIKLMEGQLTRVALILPKDKVDRLRKVAIWLDLNHGKLKSPQYHPGVDWLVDNGYSRELVKGVHLPDAAYFNDARFQRCQPCGMLHELAHAYHDQVLRFDHPEIKAAWKTYKDGGRGKKVLHVNGRPTDHYALTNPMEFFAEMTESYFGHNDFAPFNSGELKRDEPAIYELMERIWGKLP